MNALVSPGSGKDASVQQKPVPKINANEVLLVRLACLSSARAHYCIPRAGSRLRQLRSVRPSADMQELITHDTVTFTDPTGKSSHSPGKPLLTLN